MIDAALARRLKLVGLDVDGVLTDGGIYLGQVGDHPVELKRFHVNDGLAIKLLRDAGLAVVLVSARRSEATELRARELKVDEIVHIITSLSSPYAAKSEEAPVKEPLLGRALVSRRV